MSKYLFHNEECDLHIGDIHAFANDQFNGVRIEWYANHIGFGQCDIIFNLDETGEPKISADTEHMCNQDNKSFLRALLDEIIDKVEVIE